METEQMTHVEQTHVEQTRVEQTPVENTVVEQTPIENTNVNQTFLPNNASSNSSSYEDTVEETHGCLKNKDSLDQSSDSYSSSNEEQGFKLQIPRASQFVSTRLQAIQRQKELAATKALEKKQRELKEAEEKAAAEKAAQQKRVSDQTRDLEQAFKNCNREDPEVRVFIDGEKQIFEKEVQQAILQKGYNIDYAISNNHPGKTIACIYPGNKIDNLSNSLVSLMALTGLDTMYSPYAAKSLHNWVKAVDFYDEGLSEISQWCNACDAYHEIKK